MRVLTIVALLLLASCGTKTVKRDGFTKKDRKTLNCIKELIEHDVSPKTANEICSGIYKKCE